MRNSRTTTVSLYWNPHLTFSKALEVILFYPPTDKRFVKLLLKWDVTEKARVNDTHAVTTSTLASNEMFKCTEKMCARGLWPGVAERWSRLAPTGMRTASDLRAAPSPPHCHSKQLIVRDTKTEQGCRLSSRPTTIFYREETEIQMWFNKLNKNIKENWAIRFCYKSS